MRGVAELRGGWVAMRKRKRIVPISQHLFHFGFSLVLLGGVFPCAAFSDEVDDIFKLRAGNRDRVKRFSVEVLREIRRPQSAPDPKTITVRYKLRLEKLPPPIPKGSACPWRMEINRDGQWAELKLAPGFHDHFTCLGERLLGAGPARGRKRFAIKVVRHNMPISGPETTTLEYVPLGKALGIHRMEEDVNVDGLPLVTRFFDDTGKQIIAIKFTKQRRIDGVLVVEAMETVKQTPAGEEVIRTSFLNLHVER